DGIRNLRGRYSRPSPLHRRGLQHSQTPLRARLSEPGAIRGSPRPATCQNRRLKLSTIKGALHLTVASNPGHCLWCGIVPPERAKKVVDRLMARDMWTGWGIRTLSADHRAFNPYNYQTGSVWPHDNAIIAMGFKFYGFSAEAARVAHDVSVAASHFL